jgi:two-component system, cell cycle response regulator DivK
MPKILIVEDDPMNREMLARRLSWEGYQVATAANGAQAVEMAGSELPDLILMDLAMPLLNGWQATRQIKSQPETRYIPVIALTAYALSEDRTKSLAAGCDDYETKPIDFPRLLHKIQSYLTRSKGSEGLAKQKPSLEDHEKVTG